MRIPVIAGNWKMHKTAGEARSLARAIKDGIGDVPDRQVVLAPPFTALASVCREIQGSPLILAAQNVHWESKGAFTGEISIPMIEDAGCRMVIIGHSERRQYFGETDVTVNRPGPCRAGFKASGHCLHWRDAVGARIRKAS